MTPFLGRLKAWRLKRRLRRELVALTARSHRHQTWSEWLLTSLQSTKGLEESPALPLLVAMGVVKAAAGTEAAAPPKKKPALTWRSITSRLCLWAAWRIRPWTSRLTLLPLRLLTALIRPSSNPARKRS